MAMRRPYAPSSKPKMPNPVTGSSSPNTGIPSGPDASGTASPVAVLGGGSPGAVPAAIPRVATGAQLNAHHIEGSGAYNGQVYRHDVGPDNAPPRPRAATLQPGGHTAGNEGVMPMGAARRPFGRRM